MQRGKVANELNCDIVLSSTITHTITFPFRLILLEKNETPYPPSNGSNSTTSGLLQGWFCHLNKETKSNVKRE